MNFVLALGLKCALDYPITPHCPTQGCVTFTNITLRDVTIVQVSHFLTYQSPACFTDPRYNCCCCAAGARVPGRAARELDCADDGHCL